METSNITAGGGSAEKELAEVRAQLQREREIGAVVGQFYLEEMSRTTSPQDAFASGAAMAAKYLDGLGAGDSGRTPWIQLFRSICGMRDDWSWGEPDAQAVEAARAAFAQEFSVVSLTDSAGASLLGVPLLDQRDFGNAAGVVAVPLVAGVELAAHHTVIEMTIVAGTALHADRLARIADAARGSEFAQASARAQLLLSEPAASDTALQIVVDELAACTDVECAAAIDTTGAAPRVVATYGEFGAERALALLAQGQGRSRAGGVYVLPIEIDRAQVASLVITSDVMISGVEEEMLDSIAAAASAAIARHNAAGTIGSLRREATRRLVEAQERERSIIAADIHDGVLQQLGATAIRLELAQARVEQHDFDTASAIIEDGAEEIRSCARELRALLMELRPQVLDDNGLNAALQELGRHVKGVTVDVHAEVPDDLGSEYSITIFRIVQEALTNVEKHAQATRASVSVALRDDAIAIEIHDDGIGYEGSVTGPSAAGSHLGLLGMRERADMLGGHFSVRGASGGGTLIEAWLPLVPEPDRQAQDQDA